jgi:hypothetical protein
MITTSASVVRTSTNQLKVGDVIQHGNIIHGFMFTTVAELNRSTHSNRIEVLEQFSHGGIGGTWHGKNAIWYVVKKAN